MALGLEGAASARAAEYASPPRAKAARSKQGASASASAAACEPPGSLRAALGDGEVKPGYVKPKLATIVPWATHRYCTLILHIVHRYIHKVYTYTVLYIHTNQYVGGREALAMR